MKGKNIIDLGSEKYAFLFYPPPSTTAYYYVWFKFHMLSSPARATMGAGNR